MRGTATPLFNCFAGTHRNPNRGKKGSALLNVPKIAHFPQKSMIYGLPHAFGAPNGGIRRQ
jgi:hypothetical protein